MQTGTYHELCLVSTGLTKNTQNELIYIILTEKKNTLERQDIFSKNLQTINFQKNTNFIQIQNMLKFSKCMCVTE